MAVVGDMIVNVVADSSKYVAGMKASGKSTTGFRNAIKPLGTALFALGATLTAGGGIAAIRSVQHDLDKLAKTSRQLGLTGQSLRELEHAAGLAGVGTESLHRGLAQMMKTIGVGTGKTADVLLGEVADQIERIQDPSARLDIASRIFGFRSGREFLTLIEGGAQGIARMREQLQAVAITDSQLKKVEDFNDAMSNISEIFSGALQQFVIAATPEASQFAKDMVVVAKAINTFLAVQQSAGAAVGTFFSRSSRDSTQRRLMMESAAHQSRQAAAGIRDAPNIDRVQGRESQERRVLVQPAGL
jgi:hypothetical protein